MHAVLEKGMNCALVNMCALMCVVARVPVELCENVLILVHICI